MFSYGPPHMAMQKQGDQLEPTYSSSVRIQDVALRTCQKRCTIGRSGERGSGISVLVAQDDDDDIYIYIYIRTYIYIYIYKHTHTQKEELKNSHDEISAVDDFFFNQMDSKHCNTDGRNTRIWSTRRVMLKNKLHLVTIFESILVSL